MPPSGSLCWSQNPTADNLIHPTSAVSSPSLARSLSLSLSPRERPDISRASGPSKVRYCITLWSLFLLILLFSRAKPATKSTDTRHGGYLGTCWPGSFSERTQPAPLRAPPHWLARPVSQPDTAHPCRHSCVSPDSNPSIWSCLLQVLARKEKPPGQPRPAFPPANPQHLNPPKPTSLLVQKS